MEPDVGLTLGDPTEARNFFRGMRITFQPQRWSFAWWRNLATHAFWWRQMRAVVTEVDVEAGELKLHPLRWSWLRWKWVRI